MTLSKAILATLAYHDIFGYPLTQDEIRNFLIGKKIKLQLKKELSKLKSQGEIGERNGYHYLKNRSKLTAIRLQRAKYSRAKLKRAKLFTTLLTLIPTVKLVAISGALAMNNGNKNDDIDLVIISSKNTLWTTRFLANLILLPYRRYPESTQVSDRACLNIFIDESNLKISPQNLYTAHEICQMKPLWDRGWTYSRLIKANSWIYKFLPNWQPHYPVIPAFTLKGKVGIHKSKGVKRSVVNSQLPIFEGFLRSFQLWYMRQKISTERIGKHQLFFHPKGTEDWVLKQYQKRIKNL